MPPSPNPPEPSLVATAQLLGRAKAGDRVAIDALMARLPRLQRWATGRLPARARSLLDTADLVQETLLRTFEGLDRVEVRGPGGFQAYVRAAVLNRIRDQIRWATRRPVGADGVPETLPSSDPSPLDLAIGEDLARRYEGALGTLTPDEQQLLHLRIELDYDYDEIVAMTGRASPDAVRMAVKRALARLTDAMGRDV
jgi:RNA polymerase sigma factor (sigma-70 family)